MSEPSAPAGKCMPLALHRAFLVELEARSGGFLLQLMSHLKISALYWSATALELLRGGDGVEDSPGVELLDVDRVVSFVTQCRCPDGGYAGNLGHDSHLLHTLSAIQILALCGKLNVLTQEEKLETAHFVAGLQDQETGAFAGDRFGEVDSRFVYCALSTLSLLGFLKVVVTAEGKSSASLSDDSLRVDLSKATQWLLECRNFDGGFGSRPGSESHAGQIFCCVAALDILGQVSTHVQRDALGWWLAERQLPCGGLNGRPEKKQDVCYSWWVLSAMRILERAHWIDASRLADFIAACQDTQDGGIADRVGDEPDVFHTFFGLAGLSLLRVATDGSCSDEEHVELDAGEHCQLKRIDPTYALPVTLCRQLGLYEQRHDLLQRDYVRQCP
ncbi:MAG: hypothetical protein MHM6MM_002286 [Cercozoa sp. M6MM]